MSAALLSVSCSRSPEAKKASFLASGKVFAEQKEYAKAQLQFKNAAQIAPRDPEPYFEMAQVEILRNNAAGAVPLLRKVLELNPNHTGAQVRLAALKSSTNDTKLMNEAEATLKQVVEKSPDNMDAINALSLTEARLGKLQEGTTRLQEAVAKAPHHVTSGLLLASEKSAAGDVEGARKVLEKLVADNPKSAEAVSGLGQLLQGLGKTKEAEERYRQALQIDPKYSPALLSLFRMQRQLGQKAEEEKTLQQMAQLSDVNLKPMHAQYLFEEGRRNEGLAELEKLAKENPQERTYRTLLIKGYLATNRQADAIAVLNNALSKNSKDLDALQQRAQVYQLTGRLQEAQNDLLQVLRLRPDSAEAHWLLASVRGAQGQSLNQRQELTEALRLNPTLLGVRLQLVDLLLSEKASQTALETIDATPADQRGLVPVLTKRNSALFMLERFDEAQAGITKALAIQRTPELLVQEGGLRLLKKDVPGSRQRAEEALKIAPAHIPALILLTSGYTQANQKEAGLAKLKEYADQHQQLAGVQQYVGTILLNAKDMAGARNAFQLAAKAQPNDPGPTTMLARTDIAEGKFADAKQKLNELSRTYPKNTQVNLLLAMLEEQNHEYPAAIARYRNIVDAERNNIVALNNLAMLLMTEKQPDEALKYAQMATEIAPNSPEVQDTIGWAYYQKAIYPTAVRYLKTAADASKNPSIHYHLAMAYAKAGDRQRGEETWNAIRKTAPNVPEAALAEAVFAPGANGR